MGKPKTGTNIAGLVFIGCIVLGMGIGILAKHTWAGTLIGTGIGFLAMGVITARSK